jgi:hypothetical protein
LSEANFASTTTPKFNQVTEYPYPVGELKRDTEDEYDVTNLMNAVQQGYALGIYEKPKSYSGEWSPAYATFYGKGSAYEPVLTVTYEEPNATPSARAVVGEVAVGQVKVGEV